MRENILSLPTFLMPANNPAPSPMVLAEPSQPVRLLPADRRLFSELMIVTIASESAIFPIVSVHVSERRFREPSQESAVLLATASAGLLSLFRRRRRLEDRLILCPGRSGSNIPWPERGLRPTGRGGRWRRFLFHRGKRSVPDKRLHNGQDHRS